MARYYRKVIRITGEDSPNVRLAIAQLRAGQVPSGEVILQGVLPWSDYEKRRATWDPVRQCIGLDAQFWEGQETLMYPPAWLNRAEQVARDISGLSGRKARAVGIDTAEGGDETAMCAVDEYGILDLVSKKTPNTAVITGEALAFIRYHGVAPERVFFDRGGGGKQHADILRSKGFNVSTVSFGEPATPVNPRAVMRRREKDYQAENRTVFKNRRAEMYGLLRLLLDPRPAEDFLGVRTDQYQLFKPGQGFGIPAQYTRLRQELAPIPLLYDGDGKLELPPKRRKPWQKETGQKTLVKLIGHSPDQADALVMAVYGMVVRVRRPRAGAMWS